MNSLHTTLAILITILLSSCIQDDFVEDFVNPEIRIINPIDTIGFNDTYQFEYAYINNIGEIEEMEAVFSSNNPDVIFITEDGLASGLESGSATIFITYFSEDLLIDLKDSIAVTVGEATIVTEQITTGQIQTTSSYQLEGDFEYKEVPNGVRLALAENYKVSTALPGLYVYLSNNKNSIANALEIGAVEVFSGAHEYEISNVNFDDFSYIVYFCKPFNVKVGDGSL